MDARTDGRPELRHELKLVSDEAARGEVGMFLRLDRAGIRTLYPPRVVQSVYLDTPFEKALAENLAGISGRAKLRVRWYGEDAERVDASLERKVRENSLGWKTTVRIPEPLLVRGETRHRFVRAVGHRLDATWRARLHGLEPVQWVRYRREYFVSADRRVRITLDQDLRFVDVRPLARLSDAARTPSERILVLELKCAPEHLDVAADIVQRLPIPLGRCSKFVLAATRSSGPMPSQHEV